MKQFSTIFQFELKEIMKAKAYRITTVLFLLVAVIGLSLPSIFPEMLNNPVDTIMEQFNEKSTFAILDKENVIESNETIKLFFPKAKFEKVENKKELEKMVKSDKAEAGFIIEGPLKFEYFVLNSDLTDMRSTVFAQALTMNYKNKMLLDLGVSEQDAIKVSTSQATFEATTLGSDGAKNIMYTFVMIMAIYMVIILYGNTIATNVASEKGNRTMELLVTSANPTSLIFGKVLAGCAAAAFQIAVLVIAAKTTYTANAEAWNHMLDMVFDIPLDVLGAFAAFGILGFIFYAFIFGALGALVSKSEDVNSSATPITLIFVAIYLVVYIGVTDASSPIFTVASFVPFSSPMAMFARMAMVDVPLYEVLISLGILVVSTILVGMAASKIYRRATLMYGNQIKLWHALKFVKKNKD